MTVVEAVPPRSSVAGRRVRQMPCSTLVRCAATGWYQTNPGWAVGHTFRVRDVTDRPRRCHGILVPRQYGIGAGSAPALANDNTGSPRVRVRGINQSIPDIAIKIPLVQRSFASGICPRLCDLGYKGPLCLPKYCTWG